MSILTTKRGDMNFCPGCSHGMVLEHLGAALDRMGLKPEQVCFVSDIGCVGIADRYFSSHTFHGLHGRSVTYAEGIKRVHPELMVIVLIGDGGCGIGTGHLVHSARRGVGIKVVVCNNFNFGMTGGQHSPTTPECAYTSTTPDGASDYPFDICQTVAVNGAAYVARYSAFDADAGNHIEALLRTPGFALVDLWELCVPYYVAANKLTPPGLTEMSKRLGLPFGVLCERPARASAPGAIKPPAERPAQRPDTTPTLTCPGRTEICMAGSAGQHIRSAAGVVGEIVVAGGLFAAQHDDFPITVRKGHSVSNLIISDRPVRYAGVDDPDLVILLSADGEQRLGSLAHLRPACRVIADEQVAVPPTPAQVRRFDLRGVAKQAGKASASLAVLVSALVEGGLLEADAFLPAAQDAIHGKYRQDNLRAVQAGASLRSTPDNPAAGADATSTEESGSY